MEFGLLGPIEVRDGERLVGLPSRQVRRLLVALLLAPNRVVSTDRLYEVLWGAQPPESAANTLQTYVLHLRNVLEPRREKRDPGRFVLRKDPGYVLAVADEDIDALRFRARVDQAQDALDRAPELAVTLLTEALSLWRGEPLADFSFELFTQAAIVELNELRKQALECRFDAEMVLGRHTALIGGLRELVGAEPLRERLWAQLMVCLYRSGRQGEALTAFGEVRGHLVEQLGVEPSPLLSRLHHSILNHDPSLDWSPAPGTARSSGPIAAAPAVADNALPQARQAIERRDWPQAYALFADADARTELDGDGLDGLAEAAMWLGEYQASLAARQRAHLAFVAEGNTRRAAAAAIALALHYAVRLRFAVAAGWYATAERLLADEVEGAEHGYLAWLAALMAIGARQEGPALDSAQRVFKIGQDTGDTSLHALGLSLQGYLLVRRGEVNQGLRMLDEGMAAAVSGTVAPFPTSWIFCRMIDSCQLLGEYRRAAEWLDEIDSSPVTACITSYPADCDTHRTQVLVGRGAWSEAERVARRACAGMEKFALDHAGLAFYELGEVRLRVGDLHGAAAAFARASELGATTQPGAALLDRAKGKTAAAAAAIGAALADEPWDALARARLLPAEVELAVEIGDLDRARTAESELAGMADIYPSRAIAAAAAVAAGMVSLAGGDAVAAASAFRTGRHAWAEAGAPYESARARAALARALAATGRPDLASSELSQAKTTFEKLGAGPDVEVVDTLLAQLTSLPTTAGA